MKPKEIDEMFKILPDNTRVGEGWKKIEALNTWKRGQEMIGKPFTKKHFLEGLKNCGIPCSENFWYAVRQTDLLLYKKEDHMYRFSSPNPIPWQQLCSIYKTDYRLTKARNSKYASQNKQVKEVVPETQPVKLSEEEEKINWLKERGYVILKPFAVLYKEL